MSGVSVEAGDDKTRGRRREANMSHAFLTRYRNFGSEGCFEASPSSLPARSNGNVCTPLPRYRSAAACRYERIRQRR